MYNVVSPSIPNCVLIITYYSTIGGEGGGKGGRTRSYAHVTAHPHRENNNFFIY